MTFEQWWKNNYADSEWLISVHSDLKEVSRAAWEAASQQADSKVCPNCGKDKATDIHCNHKFHE